MKNPQTKIDDHIFELKDFIYTRFHKDCEEIEDCDWDKVDEKIENIISQLLADRDREVVEEIERMKEKAESYPMRTTPEIEAELYNEGYEKALDDLKSFINKGNE